MRDLFERRENLVHSGAASAAEVEDLPDDVSGGRFDSAFDRVGHVRELTRLLAITEHLDVLARRERFHEPREGHVRSLARTVDGEVPH